MNKPLTIILTVVTAGIAAAAIVSMNKRNELLEKRDMTADLLPGVEEKLASVTRVKVEQPTETITLVKRDGDVWGVEERGGYPAEREKLQKIFVGIGEFEPLEAKTANKELFGRLGLSEPSDSESPGTRITFFAENKEVASILLGNVKSGFGATQQRYVRTDADGHAWLVRTPIAADGTLNSWMDRKIADLQPNRIQSVDIDRWDDEDIRIARDSVALNDFTLKTMPEGAKAKTTGDIGSLSRAFQNLQLDDVVSAAESPDDLTSQTLVRVETFDGMRLRLNLAASELPAYYATIDAEYDAVLRPEFAEGEEPAQPLKSEEEVQQEVADLNARAEGWMFKLPDWKGTTLMQKKNSDLYTIPEVTPEDSVTTGTIQ